MRSGNRQTLDDEHFGTLLPLLQLPLAPTHPSLPLPLFPLSEIELVRLSSCHMTCCFSICIRVFLPCISCCLLIPSSYALCMQACVFTEQLFCHHATWDLVKATSGDSWTTGCHLVPTHVYCARTLVPSLCVTLIWMPGHFVLPVTVNSHIIRRLNTSHLQPMAFYQLFLCFIVYVPYFCIILRYSKENWCHVCFNEAILYSFSGLSFWFWTPTEQLETTGRTMKFVDLQKTDSCPLCIFCVLSKRSVPVTPLLSLLRVALRTPLYSQFLYWHK